MSRPYLWKTMLPMERLQKSNTKENLWIYILSLLKERELYGWEIRSVIEKKFNFRPGLITPYRVLYRLEGDGFVKSKKEERRRVYQITEKGKKELEKAKNFYYEIISKI
jgi:DNA-binding PadR family transcriptional regulator